MRNNLRSVLKEFYGTAVITMGYEACEEVSLMENGMLGFMIEVLGQNSALLGDAMDAVRGASILRTEDEIRYLDALKNQGSGDTKMALAMKKDVLRLFSINELREFDPDGFIDEVNERAALGEKHAIRLRAYMAWNGVILDRDEELAIRDWEMLAVNADEFAMLALERAYHERGDLDGAKLWKTTRELLGRRDSSMQPLLSGVGDTSNKSLELCDLIACIRDRELRMTQGKRGIERIDIHLSAYALHCDDPLLTKLQNISENLNFCVVSVRSRIFSDVGHSIGFA